MSNLNQSDKNVKTLEKRKEILKQYKMKKLENSRIAAQYDAFNPRKAERIRQCSQALNFEERRKEGEVVSRKLMGSMYCCLRLCPVCSWRNAQKVFGEVMRVIKEPEFVDQKFVFLTLTVRNCAADELRGQINLLTKAFRKLTSNTEKSLFNTAFTGTFRAVEVTYNKKADTYHPHMHVLASVAPDYFKKSNKRYMSHEKLQKAWKKHCKLDYEPVVGIQRVKGDSRKKVSEVAKYSVKSADIPNAKVLETFDIALERQRLTAFTGIFDKVRKRLKAAPELKGMEWQIHEQEAPANEQDYEIWQTVYKWFVGAKTYVLTFERRVK
jgi:plasmid rolling circle replication initiator protein Rep